MGRQRRRGPATACDAKLSAIGCATQPSAASPRCGRQLRRGCAVLPQRRYCCDGGSGAAAATEAATAGAASTARAAAQPACSHRPHSTPSAPLRSKPCRFHSLTASDPVSLAASPTSTRRRRRSTAPSSALSGARYAGRTATTAWCVASSARTYRPPRSPATAASCSTRRASKRRAEL